MKIAVVNEERKAESVAPKIIIYDTLDALNKDLENLPDGAIVATKENSAQPSIIEDLEAKIAELNDRLEHLTSPQTAFDDAHPINEVYTQYPWQKSPEELYNTDRVKSVWEIIKDYNGAFFRAEGGLADEFQEEKIEGTILKVVETPLVYLNMSSITSYVGITLTQVVTNSALTPSNDMQYTTKDMVHVISIEVMSDSCLVEFENHYKFTFPMTQMVYNYNIPVGTLEQILNRREDWKVEIHDDYSIDTTKGNTILSTASSTAPSTAQHSIRLTPIVNGTQTLSESESGVITVLNNRSSLVYDKNINLGHVEGLFTKWKIEGTPADIPYAYAPNNNDEENKETFCLFTTANTTAPTEANTIYSIMRLQEQDTYSVTYLNGVTSNLAGTTAFYRVQYNNLENRVDNPIKQATYQGQLRTVFDIWARESKTVYWFEFPHIIEEDDEYQWCLEGRTTPNSVIVKAMNPGPINSNYVCFFFEDGHYGWYNYNGFSLYFVHTYNGGSAQESRNVCWSGIFSSIKTKDASGVLWAKETEQIEYYRTTRSGDFVLSTTSSADPSAAQEIIKVYFKATDSVESGTYKNVTLIVHPSYSTAPQIVTADPGTLNIYNKNTLFGSINSIKLKWSKRKYTYTDSETNEEHELDEFIPAQDLFYGDTKKPVLRLRQQYGTNTYSLIVGDDSEPESITYGYTTAAALYDIKDEKYNWTPQQCYWSTSEFTDNSPHYENKTFYRPPSEGQWLYTNGTFRQYLWNTSNNGTYINVPSNLLDNIDYNAQNNYPQWNSYLIDKECELDYDWHVVMRKDGYPQIFAKYTYCMYAGDSQSRMAVGCQELLQGDYGLKYEKDTIAYIEPPEVGRDGNPYIGSRASTATPNVTQAIKGIYILPGTNRPIVECTDRLGYLYTFGDTLYDRNMTALGVTEPFNQLNIVAEDIEYYYPPEVDWKGEEYIASIASNANPTDAQKIVKIDPIEGSTTYNVYFVDGHTAIYANTQAIYNKNLYYTTIWGIVSSYSELKHETAPVQYNVAESDDWVISNVPIKVTRYTGIVSNNAQAFVTYDDTELTSPVLRNNTTNMTGPATTPLGYSLSWVEEKDSYSVRQESAVPNVIGSWSVTEESLEYSHYTTGAFYYTTTGGNGTDGGNGRFGRIAMDASRCSRVYQQTEEVRPDNFTFRIWKRIE